MRFRGWRCWFRWCRLRGETSNWGDVLQKRLISNAGNVIDRMCYLVGTSASLRPSHASPSSSRVVFLAVFVAFRNNLPNWQSRFQGWLNLIRYVLYIQSTSISVPIPLPRSTSSDVSATCKISVGLRREFHVERYPNGRFFAVRAWRIEQKFGHTPLQKFRRFEIFKYFENGWVYEKMTKDHFRSPPRDKQEGSSSVLR